MHMPSDVFYQDPKRAFAQLMPRIGKLLSGFKDNGHCEVPFYFYQGGLRSPVIPDVRDRQKVKNIFHNLLLPCGERAFTGHVTLSFYNGRFTDGFRLWHGAGSVKEGDKKGINRWVAKGSTEALGEFFYIHWFPKWT